MMRARIFFFLSAVLLLVTVFFSFTLGASDIAFADVLFTLQHFLLDKTSTNLQATDHYIITELRMPRMILAFLIGAVLALTGAVLQTLFRNPLADPSLIGVSSGAALGAALMLVFGSHIFLALATPWMIWLVPMSAFLGGILVTLLIMLLGQTRNQFSLGTMLLVGIAVNALATSAIGMLTYVADEMTLRSLTFWMLGSLAQATWLSVGVVSIFILPVLLLFPLCAKSLNAFLLGEAEAYHLGVPVEKVKILLLIGCAIAVGATVSIAGIIGFVGLVIPHIVRRCVATSNHTFVLPASILLGGTLLMLADLAARTWVAPVELPIGIITAILGAPFFLFLILRKNHVRS